MPTELISIINNFYKKNVLIFSFLLLILVLILDFVTGQAIQFPIFYVLPVGILSWRGYKKLSYIISFFMPTSRIFFSFIWNGEFDLLEVIINAFIVMAALTIYTYLLNTIYLQVKSREKN